MRRLHEQGTAYVRFALRYPARFQLMFRVDKHDHTNPEFVRVASQSHRLLEGAIRAATGTPAERELGPDGLCVLLAAWSIAHGFSHLALSGELGNPARGGGGTDVILNRLLPLTLKYQPSPSQRAE
jgi:Tetracyclin repressor-like, C-terminal domain